MQDLNKSPWTACLRIPGDPRVEEEKVEPKQRRVVAPVAQRNQASAPAHTSPRQRLPAMDLVSKYI